MASWLIPALKAVLPHVGDIISVAAPVFTRRKAGAVEDPSELWQKQIDELQAAAAQNATHVKDLAEQLQTTVAALEEAAGLAERRLRRAQAVSAVAVVASLLALSVAAFGLMN